MSDLISRQAAIDALGEEPLVWYGGWDEIAKRNQWRRAVKAIKAVPSAQPEPKCADGCIYGWGSTECEHCALKSAQQKTGHWIEFLNHNAYKCSECGRVIETADGKNNVYKHYPYCHCGCRMLKEGGQND